GTALVFVCHVLYGGDQAHGRTHSPGTALGRVLARLPWHVIPLAIAFSTPFQAGEEIDWRGCAVWRLSSDVGLMWACILFVVIWAVWHLAQFFIRAVPHFWVPVGCDFRDARLALACHLKKSAPSHALAHSGEQH